MKAISAALGATLAGVLLASSGTAPAAGSRAVAADDDPRLVAATCGQGQRLTLRTREAPRAGRLLVNTAATGLQDGDRERVSVLGSDANPPYESVEKRFTPVVKEGGWDIDTRVPYRNRVEVDAVVDRALRCSVLLSTGPVAYAAIDDGRSRRTSLVARPRAGDQFVLNISGQAPGGRLQVAVTVDRAAPADGGVQTVRTDADGDFRVQQEVRLSADETVRVSVESPRGVARQIVVRRTW